MRSRAAGRRAVATLAAGATSAGLLLAAPAEEATATVSGLDGLIAYVGAQDNDYDLYVADPADGSARNLTQTPSNNEQDPAWSPTGDRLAFARSQAHYDIWVMNADGTGAVNLTPGANDGQGNTGRRPAWSPDGTQIAYEDASEIWLMNADGSDKRNLTFTGATVGIEGDPVFSPDGQSIVYVRGLDLWVMDVDGSNQRPLVATEAAERSPDWSPDGEHLVYERDGEIWQVGSDGADARALVSTTRGAGTSPTYSPQGRHVAFSSSGFGSTGGPDIVVVGVDGSDPHRVAGGPLTDLAPAWQPVVDSVDLTVSAVDSPDPVHIDEPVTYTVTVGNESPGREARFVSVALLLPSGASFGTVSTEQGTCVRRRITVTCALGTLSGGTSAEVTLTVTPTSTFDLSLAGSVSAGHPDPDPDDNSFRERTEVLPPPATEPRALITWSVPDRYADYNGDWILDEQLFNNPKGARVPFKMVLQGCDSTPLEDIYNYRFAVTLPNGQVLRQSSSSCQFAFEPPKEGRYPVMLEITTADGTTVTSETTVPFRDYFIVSLGDSIASGEGNPDSICPGGCYPGDSSETWQDRACHRSALSGPSRAAWLLEAGDPTTSVTFTHLACSGAQVTAGILEAWKGIEPDGDRLVPSQADVLAALMKMWGRKPDAVLVSIGANDAKFADAVLECLGTGRCWRDKAFVQRVEDRLAVLPKRYTWLDQRLDKLGIPGKKVFITEYPDVTRNEDGQFVDCLPTLYASEWEWAAEHIVKPLNQHVRQAANKDSHGWNLVTKIHSRFREHGYCSEDHWIVRIEESLGRQGDHNGAFHPNAYGHTIYGQEIAAMLGPAL